MNLTAAIIAGFVGTAVMTGLMYMASMMGMPKMNTIGHLIFGLAVVLTYTAF